MLKSVMDAEKIHLLQQKLFLLGFILHHLFQKMKPSSFTYNMKSPISEKKMVTVEIVFFIPEILQSMTVARL